MILNLEQCRLGATMICKIMKLILIVLVLAGISSAADLPTKKVLNLATIKTMITGAEAKAKDLNTQVTICVVDDTGNLLFLEKADTASFNTLDFCRKKARHAALYRSPSKNGEDELKKGNMEILAFPDFFPNQGGLPIKVDGQTIGGIAASGSKSENDEAIAQAGIDAAFKTDPR
jgi:glc operon protein GlcG